MSRQQKAFLRIFVIGLITSFTTLAMTGNYFLSSDIPTDMLPDWNRMPELFVSAIISAFISTGNAVVLYLEKENGHTEETEGMNWQATLTVTGLVVLILCVFLFTDDDNDKRGST